jgi:hypothetical protein
VCLYFEIVRLIVPFFFMYRQVHKKCDAKLRTAANALGQPKEGDSK